MKTILLPAEDSQALPLALQTLKQGGVVAFPTDTVYGIGVTVFFSESIEKLFIAKGRDAAKAIPVLIGDPAQLAQVTDFVSESAYLLTQRFWPGPLTLVVSRLPSLPGVLSPVPTVGVRMPNHPVALALLRQSGPLATTSANLSGGPDPTTAQDVFSQLNGRIDLILDGGSCPGGVPSTVVDCTSSDLRILRQGPLSLEDLKKALGE
jgi:L-threonylcarbamoyladenylate synthase